MLILPSCPPAVPFAQGQDVSRLRAAVDRAAQEIKDYSHEYEDQRALVQALSAAEHAEPGNKQKIGILVVMEGRLEATRLRESSALSILGNCPIAESSAAQAQAVATAATATPTVATTPLTTTAAEKKR